MPHIYNHRPNIQAEFFTRDGMRFTVTRGVRRYQSMRSVDSPESSASFALMGHVFTGTSDPAVEGREIAKILHSNDVCKLSMADEDGRRWPDVIGTVKQLRTTTIEMNGSPENRTEISVEGLGSELVNYQIFWHPHIAGQTNLGGVGWLVRTQGKVFKGRPDQILRQLYDAFFNDEYIFTLSDGRRLHQAIRPRFTEITDSLATTGLSALGNEGALWSTLKRYADQPWNELFVDLAHEDVRAAVDYTLPDEVMLYFRPTPWSFAAWDRLSASHGWGFTFKGRERLDDGEELVRDPGKYPYNFFWVPASAVFSGFDQLSNTFDQSGGRLPIYDADSIRRHGLRRLEQPTEYVQYLTNADANQQVIASPPAAKTKQTRLYDLLVQRTLQLYQWHGYEDMFEGSITTRGRIGADRNNGIRIGSALTRESDGWQFYVRSVQQLWQFPGPHTTRIGVIRGHDPTAYRAWWQSRQKAVNPQNTRIVLPTGFDIA